jgi:hypothetical protein
VVPAVPRPRQPMDRQKGQGCDPSDPWRPLGAQSTLAPRLPDGPPLARVAPMAAPCRPDLPLASPEGRTACSPNPAQGYRGFYWSDWAVGLVSVVLISCRGNFCMACLSVACALIIFREMPGWKRL